MTAASQTTSSTTARSGWWTFLRLLGGWATVAALAYLLWMPSQDFGWIKMMFVWILLTLLADEFAGWFGYIGLALGVLPFLYQTPEQWFLVFPLIGGALFALLLMKHSGGPFVLPFGAALFVGAILAAAKFGVKLDPSLKLPASRSFQEAAVLPMLGVVGFSFLRQLISMLLRWNARRKASVTKVAAPVQQEVVLTSSTPVQETAVEPSVEASSHSPEPKVVSKTAVPTAPITSTFSTAAPINPSATMIDMDLEELDSPTPPSKS